MHLPLSPRATLVKMDTVMAARGEHHYTISRRVNDGTLRWVFNVAVDPACAVRNLRFWTREVVEFAAGHFNEHKVLRAVNVDKVIGEILGQRQKFSPGEVCMMLGLRRNMLMRLRDQMLTTDREEFPRRVVERFLKRRLLS